MTNHPNRSKTRTAASTPAPEDVREWRRARDLSVSQAAALIHTTPRSWLNWEAGERPMHPAFWELVRLKGYAPKVVAGLLARDEFYSRPPREQPTNGS